MLDKNKRMKILIATFNEEETEQMFLFMQHMSFQVMMFGTTRQQSRMFTRFMFWNFLRFFKYPKVGRALM